MPSLPDSGAIHIPVIIVLTVVTALVFFRDDVLKLLPDQSAQLQNNPAVEVIEDPDESIEQEKTEVTAEETVTSEVDSIFGGLVEETSSGTQNVLKTESDYPCDLEQYMLGEDSMMPYASIIWPFSDEEVDYPRDWPEGFIYPDQFTLVDHGSGKLSEESAMMYRASLWFDGSPAEATCGIIDYFENKNWQIEELINRDNRGFIVTLMDNDGIGTGIVNVEESRLSEGRAKVNASVFPEAVQSE